MPAIPSRIDTRSDDFRSNAAALQQQVDDLRAKAAEIALGGDAKSRERHAARGKLLPRERVDGLLDPGSPFLEIGQLAAFGMYDGEAPGRRDDHRHRPGLGAGMHDRRQRRDGEGRHLLPDDGEEASARPGDRAAEPPALHLPGRFRRRLPAAPGRGVSRPRALRPDLLQPGQHVRPGHRPDRGGDGLVHGGRRLRAGDERRDRHRQEPGHDLPRRAAAGEGGDRRGRQRRGARRRRRAHAALGRRRPPAPTTIATRWRSPGASSPA